MTGRATAGAPTGVTCIIIASWVYLEGKRAEGEGLSGMNKALTAEDREIQFPLGLLLSKMVWLKVFFNILD